MSEQKFEPYEKVLVRVFDSEKWKCSFYSHYDDSICGHICVNSCLWKQCIPYKGNEHLVGTNKSPKEEKDDKFEFGDKVSVRDDVTEEWEKAKFVKYSKAEVFPYTVLTEHTNKLNIWKYCRKGWDGEDEK